MLDLLPDVELKKEEPWLNPELAKALSFDDRPVVSVQEFYKEVFGLDYEAEVEAKRQELEKEARSWPR